jgi:hypothetical protein
MVIIIYKIMTQSMILFVLIVTGNDYDARGVWYEIPKPKIPKSHNPECQNPEIENPKWYKIPKCSKSRSSISRQAKIPKLNFSLFI